MILQYSRKEGAPQPSRSNPSDAGLDVRAHLEKSLTIFPGGNAVIPTGLTFAVPHGYGLFVKNRSGLSSKASLVKGAEVIDPGYTGEVFIDLHNIGDNPQTICPNDKIAQLVLMPVVHFVPQEVDQKDMNHLFISNRGNGGFGSTGN